MRRKADLPTKTCATCGRPFAWRKKWARVWDEVRYCSDRCRGERMKSSASRMLRRSGRSAGPICEPEGEKQQEKHQRVDTHLGTADLDATVGGAPEAVER